MKRILFVCGRNRLRSPTAEQVFGSHTDIEVASAGLDADSDVPCSAELVGWADTVFVMDRKQRVKLSARFRPQLRNTTVICLDIPDRFRFMDPELVRLLLARRDRTFHVATEWQARATPSLAAERTAEWLAPGIGEDKRQRTPVRGSGHA